MHVPPAGSRVPARSRTRRVFWPHLAVAILCVWLVFSSTACAQKVSGTPPVKPVSKGEDPVHRDSPQSVALAFLADYRAGNFTDAVRYLDFKHVPQDRRVKNGPRLAQ
jgi:hypothetical protein